MTRSQIANIALSLIGAKAVVDVDSDASVSSIAALLHWELVRDELLRAKDWNFATKRTVLTIPWNNTVGTVGVSSGMYNLVLSGAHGLTDGSFVYVEAHEDLPGIEGVWAIYSTAGNAFRLVDSVWAASMTSGDFPRYYPNPPRFDYEWAFPLPSDYIKALDWNGRPGGTSRADWEIINGYLYSNDDEESAELRYTGKITDATTWPASFVQTFCHALAAAMAPGLAVDERLGERMRMRAENIALQAAGPNNTETRPRAVLAQTSSHYLAARSGIIIP